MIIEKGLVSFLQECVERDTKEILAELEHIAKTVGNQLQKSYRGLVCTVGLDVGVDVTGTSFKIFEFNSNPVFVGHFKWELADIKHRCWGYLYKNKERLLGRQQRTVFKKAQTKIEEDPLG